MVVIGAIIAGVWWSNQQAAAGVCRNISIEITNSHSMDFVSQGSVYNMLNTYDLNPEGKSLPEINTQKIEDMLNNSEYIEKAECILMSNNDIHIAVTQLIPVLRVFDGNDSYYLNKVGKDMDAKGRFHADVPVVTGRFADKKDALYIMPILQYVNEDETLRDLVTMYEVKDEHNVIIVPRIAGHLVNFGDTTNIENKFAKLTKFYKEVMPVKGWQTYDLITLKWSHQIVARKRSKTQKMEVVYNPDEEEDAPSIESITVGLKNESTTPAPETTPAPASKGTPKEVPKQAKTKTTTKPKDAVSKAFGKKKN